MLRIIMYVRNVCQYNNNAWLLKVKLWMVAVAWDSIVLTFNLEADSYIVVLLSIKNFNWIPTSRLK